MRTLLLSIVLAFLINLSYQDDCLLPRDKGDSSCGEDGGVRFHYDTRTKHCQPFRYEGCNGNANRFSTSAKCKAKCSNVKASDEGEGGHGMVIQVPKCSGNVRAAVNNNSQPLTCDACPDNHKCENDVCCPNKKAACDTNYDTGKYAFSGSHTPRYFYDKAIKNCLLFTYYGALGNANNFETYNDCMKFCADA